MKLNFKKYLGFIIAVTREDMAMLKDDLKHVQAERLEASRQVKNLESKVRNLQRKLQEKKTEEDTLLAGGYSVL